MAESIKESEQHKIDSKADTYTQYTQNALVYAMHTYTQTQKHMHIDAYTYTYTYTYADIQTFTPTHIHICTTHSTQMR